MRHWLHLQEPVPDVPDSASGCFCSQILQAYAQAVRLFLPAVPVSDLDFCQDAEACYHDSACDSHCMRNFCCFHPCSVKELYLSLADLQKHYQGL